MFFIVWGSKWDFKKKENGLMVYKQCPECKKSGNFFEVLPTKYFTVFWLPIFPTKGKQPLLECPNCHEKFYISDQDHCAATKRYCE